MAQVTLKTGFGDVDMPGATTAHYAAKRIVEYAGLDPDGYYVLMRNNKIVPDDTIAAELDGKFVTVHRGRSLP